MIGPDHSLAALMAFSAALTVMIHLLFIAGFGLGSLATGTRAMGTR